MAGKIKIDGIDKIIIKRLVEDARTPILSIAREVGISGAAIHQRLRKLENSNFCLLYTSPSPRDRTRSRMPSSA